MSTDKKSTSESATLPAELKAEQALGLIGLGLMQKISRESASDWNCFSTDHDEKADLLANQAIDKLLA